MNIYGLVLGIFTFLCIGLGHVIVVKTEYYFTHVTQGHAEWLLPRSGWSIVE